MSNDPGKPDFSNVQGGSASSASKVADFGNVDAGVTSTASRTTARMYTVASGDSLSKIAKEFYGKASRWPEIFAANRDQLADPDLIKPGQVLKIPIDSTAEGSSPD